jgi:hypothetical protein
VCELKPRLPYSEFLKWVEHFDKEWNRHAKLDQYIARLTYEVFLLRWDVKHILAEKLPEPPLTEEQFLLKYKPIDENKDLRQSVSKGSVEKEEKLSDEQIRDKKVRISNMSKAKWLPFAGVDPAKV